MNTLTAPDLIKEISINWRDIYKMERGTPHPPPPVSFRHCQQIYFIS